MSIGTQLIHLETLLRSACYLLVLVAESYAVGIVSAGDTSSS